MQEKNFKRTIEDFVCDKCNYKVEGNGYTNHCPDCLYSKHVDILPGDRKCECKGLMKPTSLENKGDVFYIVHKCEKCDYERRNKAQKGDNFQKLVEISTNSDK